MSFTQEDFNFICEIKDAMFKQTALHPCNLGSYYCCPMCKSFLGDKKPNYCEECGQKLNWKVIRTGN